MSFTSVHLADSFWTPRLVTNRTVTIPHIMRQNEETGRVDNFRKAAGMMEGAFEGRRFNDTDIYKVIEAASYALAQEPDPALDAELDELIALIEEAQEEDGYLFPARTVDPDRPAPGVGAERWIHVAAGSHELYNAGHLIEAAVAHHRATGKRTLLNVARRFADLIDRDFGPDARHDIPGHEEIELALVKLADLTGEQRYVELARFFIDQRGHDHEGEPYAEDTDFAIYNDRPYKQDHVQVVEQRKASGHAVRATYLYTGMADVAAHTEAPGYREALESIWRDVIATKLYLTGGIGSRGTFESFGENYELPNQTAYTETCAAIGNDLWNHRMFLSSGDPRFLDVMERILYNGALSGVSQKGDTFFYRNPLESDGSAERSSYFEVACCPANLARLLAHLPGFVYAERGDAIFVNLFVASEARIELDSGRVLVEQETRYPWDGGVRITVSPDEPRELTLHVRIPGWAREEPVPSDLYRFVKPSEAKPELEVNGESIALSLRDGFATIRRTWREGDTVGLMLPMPVRRVRALEAVENNRGRLAIQRGPLVYAAEAVDNGGRVLDLVLPEEAELEASYREDLLGGVVAITGTAERGGAKTGFLAIPYFSWANRGRGEMVVWIPTERP
ncbi:MAG TPA: beta-L-arabinofuranosidase domain-containing protein [Vicinamibacteria bacterium]|nr:beta-L-arabinofuranosidase domain-containing protein [Vicinamibacteria bacterium]